MFYYRFGMIATGHRRGYVYRNQINSFLLMRFRTDFFMEAGGKVLRGKAGDLVLHAPNTTIAHGAATKQAGFINDWIFFDADPSETEFLKQLPFDTPISGDSAADFVQCLSQILEEHIRKDPYSQTLISHLIYRMLTMLKRAQLLNVQNENEKLFQFKRLRIHFHKHCQQPWTLQKMAEYSGYSASHFSAQYKALFGISPMEDLLNKRVALAKHLLKLKTHKVSEVAKLCGFSSLHYFSEYFKKQTGKAPSKY